MILIVAEHVEGRLKPINRELAAMGRGLARELSCPLGMAFLGKETANAIAECQALMPDRIFVVDDDKLAEYSSEGYVAALAQLAASVHPVFVVAPHTSGGYDFIPRLAARLGKPAVAGCIAYQKQGGRIVLTRQIFNAKLHMRVSLRGDPPYFATMAPGAFPVRDGSPDGAERERMGEEPAVEATVDSFAVDLSAVPIRVRVVQREAAAKGEVDLGSAGVIVAGGRGLKEKSNLHLIEELAESLDGAVGASRPVVDMEWLPRERQIGSSGQTVSPKLYIAVGISGAVQHLVGMQSARCIVAINKDPDAPIFKVAHYGIVDDLFKVVPEITKTIQALKRQARI